MSAFQHRIPLDWTWTLSENTPRWTNSSRMVASYKAMFFVWPLGQGYSDGLSQSGFLTLCGAPLACWACDRQAVRTWPDVNTPHESAGLRCCSSCPSGGYEERDPRSYKYARSVSVVKLFLPAQLGSVARALLLSNAIVCSPLSVPHGLNRDDLLLQSNIQP